MIFQTRAGDYRKMGTEQCADGVTFTFQCPKELACAVVLFEKKTGKQAAKIDVLPQYRVGSVRSVTIYPLKAEKYYYCYEIEGKRVRDPYGERVIGREKWGDTERTLDDALLSGFKKEGFDWSEDVSVEIPANEMVMYKLHVRGFSMDGRGRNKGTFAAVMDRLSYLKELGITTLECMPVYEFEELMENGRLNYWGYAPSDYFAVKSSYASQKDADWEFKSLILETHKQQMELIMEMHFVPEQTAGAIIEILRYWVMEYHVDGFILNPYNVPMDIILKDPILSGVRILRHADEFQNVMRRFLKGDEGVVTDVMYQTRKRWDLEGIYNCITTHTGFTLKDLVSYDGKHNEANGENNQDGPDYNYSWNCGAEGLTRKKAVLELRKNQMRNAMFLLLLSQGVPCILAGDEFANSQKGNNNVYCQDNPIGWLNWRNLLKEQEMYQFVKQLIKFRKKYRLFHQEKELLGIDQSGCGMPDVSYHGEMAWRAPTEVASRQIGIYYSSQDKEEADCFVAYNMHWLEHEFALPALKKGRKWYRAASTKEGILKDLVVLENQRNIELDEREIVVLVSGKGETV